MQFIIVEPDPIVEMDLTGTIARHFPGAKVQVAQTLRLAEDISTDAAGPVVLIAAASNAELSEAVIARRVRTLNGRIITTAPSNTLVFASPDVIEVPKPFTTQMILDALMDVTRDGSAPLPASHI